MSLPIENLEDAQEVTYREAIRLALDDSLQADASVVLLGEDIAAAGGPFKTTEGLVEKYGEDRVIDTPIAENGFFGYGYDRDAPGCGDNV